jgi:GH24 family phage-related lysozyme (muramidase)
MRGSFRLPVPRGLRAGALVGAILLLGLVGAVEATELPGATRGPHRVDDAGLRFMTKAPYDSFSPRLYNDPVHCTIGYGHKVSDYGCQDPRAAKEVAPFLNGIDREQALQLLATDVAVKSVCVNRAIAVPITQSQFDGLLDFAYNAGCEPLKRVAKFVNEGDLKGAASKLKEYVKGDVPVKNKKTGKVHIVKKVLGGLVKRRGEEAQLVTGQKTTAQLLGNGGGGTGGRSRCTSIPTGVGDTRKPPHGCLRLYVSLVSANYPTDPENKYDLGQGAGQVTVMPSGRTFACDGGDLPPEEGGGRRVCARALYVAAGATVTLTAKPLSTMGDPPNPPDSELQKWDGACSGSGPCSFRMSANDTPVAAYFGPALVPLSIHTSPGAAAYSRAAPRRSSTASTRRSCSMPERDRERSSITGAATTRAR